MTYEDVYPNENCNYIATTMPVAIGRYTGTDEWIVRMGGVNVATAGSGDCPAVGTYNDEPFNQVTIGECRCDCECIHVRATQNGIVQFDQDLYPDLDCVYRQGQLEIHKPDYAWRVDLGPLDFVIQDGGDRTTVCPFGRWTASVWEITITECGSSSSSSESSGSEGSSGSSGGSSEGCPCDEFTEVCVQLTKDNGATYDYITCTGSVCEGSFTGMSTQGNGIILVRNLGGDDWEVVAGGQTLNDLGTFRCDPTGEYVTDPTGSTWANVTIGPCPGSSSGVSSGSGSGSSAAGPCDPEIYQVCVTFTRQGEDPVYVEMTGSLFDGVYTGGAGENALTLLWNVANAEWELTDGFNGSDFQSVHLDRCNPLGTYVHQGFPFWDALVEQGPCPPPISSSSDASSNDASSSDSSGPCPCDCIQMRFVPFGGSEEITIQLHPLADCNYHDGDDIEVYRSGGEWWLKIGGVSAAPPAGGRPSGTECPFGSWYDTSLGDVVIEECTSSTSSETLSSQAPSSGGGPSGGGLSSSGQGASSGSSGCPEIYELCLEYTPDGGATEYYTLTGSIAAGEFSYDGLPEIRAVIWDGVGSWYVFDGHDGSDLATGSNDPCDPSADDYAWPGVFTAKVTVGPCSSSSQAPSSQAPSNQAPSSGSSESGGSGSGTPCNPEIYEICLTYATVGGDPEEHKLYGSLASGEYYEGGGPGGFSLIWDVAEGEWVLFDGTTASDLGGGQTDRCDPTGDYVYAGFWSAVTHPCGSESSESSGGGVGGSSGGPGGGSSGGSSSNSEGASSSGCPDFVNIGGTDYTYDCLGGDMTEGVLTDILAGGGGNNGIVDTNPCSPWTIFIGSDWDDPCEISFGVSRASTVTIDFEMIASAPLPNESQVILAIYLDGVSVTEVAVDNGFDTGTFVSVEVEIPALCGGVITVISNPAIDTLNCNVEMTVVSIT